MDKEKEDEDEDENDDDDDEDDEGYCLFDWPVNELPPGLTHLAFGFYFNRKVNNLPNITHLAFGANFNQPVDSLPSSLLTLIFGYYFNHPVNALPNTLRTLIFGYRFNQPLNSLPPALKELHLGYRFNQDVSMLPPVTHVTLGSCFDKPIDALPNSITSLCLHCKHSFQFNHLPDSLLVLHTSITQIDQLLTLQALKATRLRIDDALNMDLCSKQTLAGNESWKYWK